MTTLDDYANVRAGDKGDTLILAVVCRSTEGFDTLREKLSATMVGSHYGVSDIQTVTRHELPAVHSFVFKLPGVLGGGVTGSPVLDGHGKCISYHLLSLEIGA